MKNLNKLKFTALVLTQLYYFSSCKKEDNNEPSGGSSGRKIYVMCEGNYTTVPGTISAINADNNTVENNLFGAANSGAALGDVVESMLLKNGKSYIVVNNSNKIEVVNQSTFVSSATINGFNQPRYIIGGGNNKAYVTEYSSGLIGNLKVLDLNSNSIIKTIPLGHGPENLISSSGKIFISNTGVYDFGSGGVLDDTSVMVFDPITEAIIDTIAVGVNPSAFVEDLNGKLWVICNGNYTGVNASLVKINPVSRTVESTVALPVAAGLARLAIDKTKSKIYFVLAGAVKQFDINSGNIIDLINRNFYSLAVDPVNGNLICGDARDFNSNGWIIRYPANSSAAIDSFEVGINPGNFCFE